jgi:hypothetical protein
MGMLEKKIDDVKFLNVIRKMLKAGYLEDWRYHRTYSGTPQGGIISPILANIYLHELDCFVEGLISRYHQGQGRRKTTERKALEWRIYRLNQRIDEERHPQERGKLIQEKRTVEQRQLETPSSDQYDPGYRRLRYCRYADDFVLGVIGPKSEAVAIMEEVKAFLPQRLHLKHSEAKTGLKHNSEVIRFLGYDITVINSERIVKGVKDGRHFKKRVGKAHISLYAPLEKMQAFTARQGYGNWEKMVAIQRPSLIHLSDAEITLMYSAELRGLAEYYALADNFSRALWRLRFLWMQSFQITLANKYQSSMTKMADLLNRGNYYAVRERKRNGELREVKLFDLKSVDRLKPRGETVDHPPLTFQWTGSNELLQRMQENTCEYCERQGGYFEIHHVRKLADIKDGKQPWERLMIARRRKTLVLCVDCHDRLHAGKLPDWRHLRKKKVESRVQ